MAAQARGVGRSRVPGAGFRADYRVLLWFLIGAGVVGRLIIAFTTEGHLYDLQSEALVNSALHKHVFGVYHQLDDFSTPPYGRWPYPPGFFLAIVPLAKLAHVTGLAFASLIRVPGIVCDAAIAWLVQDFLRHRGFSVPSRLVGVALVALGPSFAAISAYHGQIDSVAILPAVGALVLWTRSEAAWRPYAAGALIGIGAAVKTVPLVMLLALAPSARSWREAAQLVITAVAIPLAAIAPWLILDGPGTSLVFRYRGGPGLGGLSLLTNPRLPLTVFGVGHESVGGLTQVVYDNARWITGGALLVDGALVVRYRPPPVDAAVLVWLAVWVFGVTFFLQYTVWGLPFLLMAGYLRTVLVLQAALLAPTIITYTRGLHSWQVWGFYTVPMIVLWVAFAVGAVLVARRIASGPRLHAPPPAGGPRLA
jgi:hypothetical protein